MAKFLVCSTFEGGYQPTTAISAATVLQRSGQQTSFVDVYVSGADKAVQAAIDVDYVAISVPMFDSLTAGIQLSKKIKESGSDAKIIFFGQYASINVNRLTENYGDYAIAGEWEKALPGFGGGNSTAKSLAFVRDTSSRDRQLIPIRPPIERDAFVVPDRSVAPTLDKYPQLQLERLLGKKAIVGGTEYTRGCHHKCSYCSVFAAYDGKVIVIPDDVVLRDVEQLVDQGMTHLTFIDADFFNTKRKGVDLMRTIHDRYPHLTFDFTTRVDHILENKEAIRQMYAMGLLLITTALEFPSQEVLDQVFKEMTLEMVEESIHFIKTTGIKMNPTFIMFNPWVGLEQIVQFHAFVERTGLEHNIDPVQYETRLHLYKGSPLLDNDSIKKIELVESEFHYDWKHPDPIVDDFFASIVQPVPEGEFKRCCLKC